MLVTIPILISFSIGYLALRFMLRKSSAPLMILLFMGASLGMGLSSTLVFSSLFVFGRLSVPYAIGMHVLVLIVLSILLFKKLPSAEWFPLKDLKRSDLAGLGILVVFLVPVVVHAWLYPHGGWDAWSCWNLKARFIFLGGEDWKRMLDPLLWWSNIAYPLLVPCLNVWGWCFGKEPNWIVPLINTCLITLVCAGTLLFAVKKLAGRLHGILAATWLLSILFIVKLSSSQYSDLMVGNFFLTALVAFLYYIRSGDRAWLSVMAAMLGFLSFTKSEGLVLALVTVFVTSLLVLLPLARNRKALTLSALAFFPVLIVAFLPTLIFQLAYAPDSHTFINGLISSTKPTSTERLRFVLAFWGVELISWKWNGLWLLSLAGLVLSWGKCFRKELWIIPATLTLYCLAIVGVYWINTFFDIGWWLSTTLNRILFAMAPSIILWVFLSLE